MHNAPNGMSVWSTWCRPPVVSLVPERTFQIVYAGKKSAVVIIPCSVPQGSVLGPWLFILYMADLADVVSAHDAEHHIYTHTHTLTYTDTQLYLWCHAQEVITAAHRLEMCITDVQRWMETNRLSLMLIRQSFSGPGLDMVRRCLGAVDRHSILEQGPSEPVTMCVSLVSQCHLTLVLRSMFLAYVRQTLFETQRCSVG